MSFESLMRAVQRLSASSEALAALGGELRLRQSGEESDPRTRQLLHDVIRGIDSTLLDGVSSEQEAIALAVIRSGYHYTIDLLDKPGRAPGWLHEDEEILQLSENNRGGWLIKSTHLLDETLNFIRR